MQIILLEGRRELGRAKLTTRWELQEPFQFVNHQAIVFTNVRTGLPTHFAIEGFNARTLKIGFIDMEATVQGNTVIIRSGDLHVDVQEDTDER